MIIKKRRSFFRNTLSLITFLISLILSHSIGEIFYNSIDGTDFYRYFRYIEYFMGEIETPTREQGLFYFWIISLFIKFSQNFYVPENWEYIYSTAIQLGNLVFYLVGIFGLIYLLRSRKVPWEKIFLVFSVLNFFPPLFGGRLIMKPEILAFAFLPWVILAIDNYLEKQNYFSLIYASLLLSIIATSKGTVALITFVSLGILYFSKINLFKIKNIVIPGLVFLLSFYFLYSENVLVNTISFLTHEEQSSYLFKAKPSFLYNINFADLYTNPYRNTHANSLIGITLIDLFNDYFNRYWEHPRSIFVVDRVNLFDFLAHPRRNFSVILSILFVISTFYKINRFKFIYLIGTIVLAFTSLGLFGLHFNPEKGDTLKTHYYFFLLAISFVFVLLDLFKSKKFWINYTKALSLIAVFLFIFGFPKNYTEDSQIIILEKIPTTISCNYVKPYFNTIFSEDIQCLDKEMAVCGNLENYNLPKMHQDGYLIFQPDENYLPKNLIDENGNPVTVNGFAECVHYIEGGFYPNNGYFEIDRTPKVNNIFIYLSILSIIGITYNRRKQKVYSSS
ncbi:MAG: hypothetical protein CBD98_003295 [Flavobacteriaceae bacterium TMED238]|nr:MAG: hypothetical protein CBD98_003295 [Flavobacteriaceae bacterium TMED238]